MRKLSRHTAARYGLLVGFIVCLFLAPWVEAGNNAVDTSANYADPELRLALEKAVANTDSFENRFDAEVWLLDMSTRLARYIKNPTSRMHFLRLVHAEATRAGVEPELVLAVIEVESTFRRFAISSAGAQGYMQVMPFWLEELKMPDGNLFDMDTNLRFGCTILKHYLDREKGNTTRALARYNGSLGSYRYPQKVYAAYDRNWAP